MKRLQRMPGTSFEKPRAHKLTDLETHQTKYISAGCGVAGTGVATGGGSGAGNFSGFVAANACNELASPLGCSNSMGSIARFPKLDECAHFHYEHVELTNLEVQVRENEDNQGNSSDFAVRVSSGEACWTLQRSYENLVMFDKQLHRCIFDRSFSQLAELETEPALGAVELNEYFERFSNLSHEGLNCGPVLNWLQLDNRGRRILVPEADSCPINTPAVAAAYAVRPYTAQAQDEISFQVGDMISVIDMPPAGESSWWRGKHGFAVGFFPAECVAVIGDKLPRQLLPTSNQPVQNLQQPLMGQPQRLQPSRLQQPVKPVLRKHGKLIAFFRSFILNRPSRRRLKQSGILRERVFGCDLGEHLLNSGQEVPTVLRCCAEFIENHGIVDGIYRLSGVSSNIQRLRHAFDEDRQPQLNSDEAILHDIHSVASLLKMYFRDLPNPLCTYQLYSSFVAAVQASSDAERLDRMRDAVRKLPPPHYRTLEYLMRHLVRVAARGEQTGMTPRNVAIVWAPNLLRCKELEVGGVAALQGVGVQAVVTEFLICYAELIFAPGPPSQEEQSSPQSASRPKSLALGSLGAAAGRLLSLDEARSRSLAPEPDLMEVGQGGPPPRYHTVLEMPASRRRGVPNSGSKRSPSLNWRALFGGGRQSSAKARARQASAEAPPSPSAAAIALRKLRPVKSADSLDGQQTLQQQQQQHQQQKLHLPQEASTPRVPSAELRATETQSVASAPREPRSGGHSRSVSHDSYFEQLVEPISGSASAASASALDLSEIQLSFELEEREMRMLSEDGSGGRPSLEASPRRQLTEVVKSEGAPGAIGGGSKRKRSRLEERLHCDVELRFIDSQSPDQIMLPAEMESPSSLPTPGYLPLLSEGSTPLTPAASPRISFKSFSLPLDIGEPPPVAPPPPPPDHERPRSNRQTLESAPILESESTSLCTDHEMTPCERLLELDTPSDGAAEDFETVASCSHSTNAYQGFNDSNKLLPSTIQSEEVLIGFLDKPAENDANASLGLNESNDYPELFGENSCVAKSLISFDSPCEESDQKIQFGQESKYNSGNYNSQWLITNSSPSSLLTPTFETSFDKSQNLNPCFASMTNSIENSTTCKDDRDYQESMSCSIANYESFHNEDSTQNDKIESSSSLNSNYQNVDQFQNDDKKGCDVESVESNLCPISMDSTESPSNYNDTSCSNKDNSNVENLTAKSDSVIKCHDLKYWDESLTSNKNLGDSNPIKNELDFDGNANLAHSSVCKSECESGDANICDNIKNDFINVNDSESTFDDCHKNNLVEKISDLNNQDDLDIVVPSASAAVEPQEMAHVPNVAESVIISPKNTFSHSINTIPEQETVVQKDTATILQELALQRLSGADKIDLTPVRRRYDSDYARDRRSFDSEIGREIVREHKIKQELENARGKLDDSFSNNRNQIIPGSQLPPCLRARQARATRAALSRSLDEGKFNKMTNCCGKDISIDEASRHHRQQQHEFQHGSTPNVDVKSSLQSAIAERSIQSLNKTLGLDLDDPRCRERIEKYKEERRSFLRDKYRSESFRGSATAGVTVNVATAESAPNESVDGKRKSISPRIAKKDDEDQALLTRLKQRASRASLL